MRYKNRVTQLLDSAENLVNNLVTKLPQRGNGGLTPQDITDSLGAVHKSLKTAQELVDLEGDDFSRTAGAKAPGQVTAPVPHTTQPRGAQPNPTMRRDLDAPKKNTERVETLKQDEDQLAGRKQTKRVELAEDA